MTGLSSWVPTMGLGSHVPDEGSQVEGSRSRVPCMGPESRAPLFRFAKNNMPIPNYKIFVQSCICQISIKKNSTKFLTLSKFFANFGFTIVKSHFFANITLSMEVVINITSQSSIIIACFNHVPHILPKQVKGVSAV